MLYGIGQVNIGTTKLDANSLLGQNLAFDQCVASVAFATESNSVSASCYVNGVMVNKASKINSELATVTLTYEYLDWPSLQLLYGEIAQAGEAFIPTAKTITTTANTFTESDITVANQNVTSFRLFNNTEEKFMTLTVDAPGVNEYQINNSGQVTLNAAQVGQTLTYRYDKKYSSIESIGSNGQYDELDNLSLTAILYSSVYPEGIVLVADNLARTTSPSFSISGDKAVIEMSYSLNVLPGQRKAYRLYKLAGATV